MFHDEDNEQYGGRVKVTRMRFRSDDRRPRRSRGRDLERERARQEKEQGRRELERKEK